jgi:2,4-dienoyl-CoA reductase-like NADH-dependent reductase (Old Yellow Enzyme family)
MKNLFDVTKLGRMTLQICPCSCRRKTQDRYINKYVLDLYKQLAQGGVGTMVTGFTLVDEAEKSFPLMAFYNNSFNESHKKLTNLTHTYNANIILKLVYVGSYIMATLMV